MFKFLSEFLISFNLENDTINAYINRKNDAELAIFITGIEKFPFYKQVLKKLKMTFLILKIGTGIGKFTSLLLI